MRKLDDWINSWLEFTENTEPPICYKEWVAISIIAAALQRKCMLNLGHLIVYPNLYIILIGPPGTRKTTAMEPGREILMQKGIRLAASATTKEALIRAIKLSNKSTTNLTSGEVLGHASLTIFSEELTVFLGYDNLQLMTYLNNWFDCQDPWIYDTKDEALRDYIDAVWVNMIGATTPSILQSAMPAEAVGAGFTSRIIFVYAEKMGKVVPIPYISEEAAKTREDLFTDLEYLHNLSGKFTYTKGFLDKYIDWRYEQDKHPPFDDPQLAGYLNKRPIQVLKLCMIVSASESNDMVITSEMLDRALSILSRAEVDMPYVFSGFGESRDSRIMGQTMRSVALAGEKGILFSTLMDRYHRDADKDTMQRVLRTLSSMKFCRQDVTDPSNPRIMYTEEKKSG